MVMAFELVAVLTALALAFVLGRIWEIRQEIRRDRLRQRKVTTRGVGSMAGSQRYSKKSIERREVTHSRVAMGRTGHATEIA
jgi:hypothetical protein